ncbi:hypothetical protein L3Q82_017456, partial [Scortum barcoo]
FVLRRPHFKGWFRAFVDALRQSGCERAADYVQAKLPEPEEEAEDDDRVRLIRLLCPTLVDMQTEEVCVHCLSEELLTEDDCEVIRNLRGRAGARELLRRIMRRQHRWFSKFLKVLRETDHNHLYRELTGSSPNCEKPDSDEKLSSVKGEPGGGEAAIKESPAEDESLGTTEYMEIDITENPQREATDLYQGAIPESKQLPDSTEPSQADGTDSVAAAAAAARGPEKDDIVLRDYQMEVARPALEGKNIIICLPTGSGKTRVAVYITKKHLDRRREEGRPGKVVVLVNKIPLVEQHYSAEFSPFLKRTYKLERVSGDCQLKISFTEIVKKNDVIICTAQILENYLERFNNGEDEGVNLSDLTLIVIDECHHTQKGGVYNHIMMRYLKQKHKNKRLKKEQKEPVALPQILGLTASPGVGGATKMEKAEEHILRICANLDASKIMTTSLGNFKKEQRKDALTVEDRKEDPFGDVIKEIMSAIHAHAELSPTCDLGSQNYEQWVVQKERKAAAEENQKVRDCAEHLRQYSEGLNLCNTIRMRDAFSFLNKFHMEEIKRKTSPDDEQTIKITDTERFLFNLFKEKKKELEELAEKPEYENDSLSKLRTKILQEFSSREAARGIIFTKTRRSAIALSQWIQENPKFADIGVKASHVIGGGDQSVVKPMTAAEQKDVLSKFQNGEINLLIATTVAEEGLDIPACNFVIRYGLVTNEIAMIQAQGRGRADDSSYTLVEVKNSGVTEKECVNEYRKSMMNKAINKIRALDQAEYDKRITEFQMQAIMEEKVRNTKKKQKGLKSESPSAVTFSCRRCSKLVCTGKDIEIIENMHRVNVTAQFSELFIQRENTTLQERLLDYETNSFIACKDCGQNWGTMMLYRGIDCPCLHVKNFVVAINGKKITKCTKWIELPVRFSAFDYAEHASQGCSKVVLGLLGAAVVITLITITAVHFSNSQGIKRPYTFEDYFNDTIRWKSYNLYWISDKEYLHKTTEGNVFLHNAETKEESLYLSNSTFAQADATDYMLSGDYKYIAFESNYTKKWRHSYTASYSIYNRESSTFVTPVDLPPVVQYFAWAPIGNKYAYVSNFNLFFKSDITAEAVQVTHNGKKNEILNGVPDWVYEEEVFASNGAIWWSTTGRLLAYAEFNDTEVHKVEFSWYGSDQYPQTVAVPYPKAGSSLTKVKLFVVDTTNPSRRTQVVPPASIASGDHILCSVTWVTDQRVAVQWLTRKQNFLVVQIYDFDGSSWRETQKFEQTSKTGWVGHYVPLPVFFAEDKLSFYKVMSDTQGYKHIHYVKNGKATPITSGKWEVIYISKLTKDAIYYVSNEYQGIPVKRNLYKVMTGSRPSAPQCLTCGLHEDRCQYNSAYFSLDASYYRMDCYGPGLPLYTLVDNTGKGEDLWYQMMLPPNFKKSRKYPLLIDVYAGPCSQRVDYRFKLNWGTYLASSHGFIIASFDGRGSGYQGDEIMHAIYRRLGTFEVEDQITAVRKFIDMGFIDKDRIAIWGWSYGGYVTSMALGAGTGLFKCGIAVAPVAKWEYYDAVYTERYMGKPTENSEFYNNSTVTARAKNFKTVDYLLVHGTADDNVHFQQAAQISKALVDEQVDFEAM